MSRFAWSVVVVAFACAVGGACRKDAATAASSSDPVVARMIVAERATCACKTLTCATAAARELGAWLEVYGDDVKRAVADPTREAQIDLHRGRADACRRALADRASPADRAAVESEDGAAAAIAQMGTLADQLCACADMPCAEGVMRAMSAMKEPRGKPTKEQMERAMKIAEKMAACQRALMTAGAPDEGAREGQVGEAELNLNAIAKAAEAEFAENATFPKAAIGLTPPRSCCDYPGKKCPVVAADWNGVPAWDALGFEMTQPSYFQYSYAGDGASYEARAVGDLDCDGVTVTYVMRGSVASGSPTSTLTRPARAD